MKLIVGLVNIGEEYINTRHNIGFMVLDYFVKNFSLKSKFNALLFKDNINGEDVLFVKPTTYMNNSGITVALLLNYYHINIDDILVIQDDMDLDIGRFKLKKNSSSGGHNGIKSIIQQVGTDGFLRLKIGISHDKNKDTINYVLGKFSKSELDIFNNNVETYKDIIYSFIKNGSDKTIALYNKRIK